MHVKKDVYKYPSMPEVLPKFLIGKTTQDVHPRDAMKFFPKRRAWSDGWRYVLLSVSSEVFHVRTSEHFLDEIKAKIVRYLHEVSPQDPQRLEKDLNGFEEEVWPVLRETMRCNYGMAKMVYDYAYRSRFLPRAILVGAQAVLLELFHSGRTRSISGEFEYIPYDDAMIEMIVWEPISLVMRERTEFSQANLLRAYQDYRIKYRGSFDVLSCGAGLLPLLRTNGFVPPPDLRITAIDMDVRNLENLKLVFDKPIAEYGVNYLTMDFVDYCNDPKNAGKHPMVEALGVLSYYHRPGETKQTIQTLLRVVAPGGILVCDRQLIEPHLLRCAYSMGWKSNLLPDLCALFAIMRMRWVCRQLGVRIEYKRSRYLKHPAGINFVLYKPTMHSHRK